MAVLFVPVLRAQYTSPYVVLQGALMTAGGTPAANATLTLTPSQLMFVAGIGTVVSPAQCSTDVSGNVVGLPNPVSAPTVSPSETSGTLPAADYYVKFAWYDQFGAITLTSPEVAKQLSLTGMLTITPPAGSGPPAAAGMVVYIGTAPGGETFQGYTTSTTASYVQETPLVTTGGSTWTLTGLVYGSSVPASANNTACRAVANDAAWPTGTGYRASLVDASGNALFNYPAMWQLLSPGSTYNLSNGLPYYHGQVTYPVPILTAPYNHNPQSISGPLSMGQYGGATYPIYNVQMLGVGTATPAYGVDAEGVGALGRVNAALGFLVNGTTGSSGSCLGSDGTAWDTSVACLTASSLHYQTVESGGTAEPQEPALNFLSSNGWTLADVSGSATTVALNTYGTDAKLATTAGTETAGHCVNWDANGGMGDAGAACYTPGSASYAQQMWVAQTLCTPATSTDSTCTGSFTYPASFAFADTNYGLSITALSSAGAGVYALVTSKSTTGFGYAVWCTYGCSSYGTLTFDILGTHP